MDKDNCFPNLVTEKFREKVFCIIHFFYKMCNPLFKKIVSIDCISWLTIGRTQAKRERSKSDTEVKWPLLSF